MTWWQIHNLLYWKIVINYDLLSIIFEELSPKSILIRVIVIKNDNSKYKSYGANLRENNEENNLYHPIKSTIINELGIFSSCIYIDINEPQKNRYLKLISAIHKLLDDNSIKYHNNETRLILNYNFHDDGKFLND